MRSALIIATVAIVLAVASCAQSSAGDAEVEQTGSIVLTEDQKAGRNGAMYIEGAVGEVILRDFAGQEISRDSGSAPLRFSDLAPGLYTVQPALRPCEGNCGYLGARTDGCAATLRFDAGVVRLHVTYRVGEPCQIQRKT